MSECLHHLCLHTRQQLQTTKQSLKIAESKLISLGYDKCDICEIWSNKPCCFGRCRNRFCLNTVGHIDCKKVCSECELDYCNQCFPNVPCNSYCKSPEIIEKMCISCHTNKCILCFEFGKFKYLNKNCKSILLVTLLCFHRKKSMIKIPPKPIVLEIFKHLLVPVTKNVETKIAVTQYMFGDSVKYRTSDGYIIEDGIVIGRDIDDEGNIEKLDKDDKKLLDTLGLDY